MVDATIQEKAIYYPTDIKLAIKIINRLNKLAKAHGIKQKRTYVKEIRLLSFACRHNRHVKVRAKEKSARPFTHDCRNFNSRIRTKMTPRISRNTIRKLKIIPQSSKIKTRFIHYISHIFIELIKSKITSLMNMGAKPQWYQWLNLKSLLV